MPANVNCPSRPAEVVNAVAPPTTSRSDADVSVTPSSAYTVPDTDIDPPTCTAVADARQLLVSLLSVTTCTSSAHASRTYVPSTVLLGIVTVTVAVDVAFTASTGTGRVPVKSFVSATPSLDR
jgi:hypothetical protein